MSTLLIDAGNARVKWALSDADGVGSVSTADYRDGEQAAIAAILGAVTERVTSVVIGNVAGSGFGKRLETALAEGRRLEVWFARPQALTAGVHCAYDRPLTLGVDRWAAIVAAVARLRSSGESMQRALCIVDAGTALTIDAVSRDGVHLGGLILPGLTLQRRALIDATADIPPGHDPTMVRSLRTHRIFAASTAQALAISGPVALASAVDRCVDELARETESRLPWLVLTGGDAPVLKQWLATPSDICPNLVFEGLAILFQHRSVD